MKPSYILSIDQGTTGTKVLLLDRSGAVAAMAYRKHSQHYPEPGWVEHDPNEIWMLLKEAVISALRQASAAPEQVEAVGLANQGETVMFWDSDDGAPLYPAIVWSCKRSAGIAERWASMPEWSKYVSDKTGLRIDAYFSATKLRWMLEELPNVRAKAAEGSARCGTLDTWFIWKMTGGSSFVTDVSTAARTLLMDIRTFEWDSAILRHLEIERSWLPRILNSVDRFGITDPESFCGIRAPIRVSLVDQSAALYGHSCTEPGTSKCTYGTGCFLHMNIGPVLPEQLDRSALLVSPVWSIPKGCAYALDGAVLSAGSALEWAHGRLGLFGSFDKLQISAERWKEDLLAGRSEMQHGGNGVLFIPALSGIGAPVWNGDARGAFYGLSHRTDRDALARAVLEGIAHRVADVAEAMQQSCRYSLQSLKADGGLTVNPYLMQVQAEWLGMPVEAREEAELTTLGLGKLLGESCGWWTNGEMELFRAKVQTYRPSLPPDIRKLLRERWRKCLNAAAQLDI